MRIRLLFSTGVVAGTTGYRTRRWKSRGGMEEVTQGLMVDTVVGSSGTRSDALAEVVLSGETLLGHGFAGVVSGEDDSGISKSEVPGMVLRLGVTGEDDSGNVKFALSENDSAVRSPRSLRRCYVLGFLALVMMRW